MSFINYSSREINCKIVYYGPGLCGKTTNLQYIYTKTNPDVKGKMISLATETERTLFFDFLPLALGQIGGCKTRFHLYTVPGQVFYDASRKLILKGVMRLWSSSSSTSWVSNIGIRLCNRPGNRLFCQLTPRWVERATPHLGPSHRLTL